MEQLAGTERKISPAHWTLEVCTNCTNTATTFSFVKLNDLLFWIKLLQNCWRKSEMVNTTYSVSQKKSPLRTWGNFSQTVGNFSTQFTCLLCFHIYATLQMFIQLSATLTKLCHIKRDHPVHIMCARCPPSAETHAGIFSKQLGIFSPNFTHLLNVHMHARMQIFIQLSPTVTKLCHIMCDHPACALVDGGHFEHIMVVALNMA